MGQIPLNVRRQIGGGLVTAGPETASGQVLHGGRVGSVVAGGTHWASPPGPLKLPSWVTGAINGEGGDPSGVAPR